MPGNFSAGQLKVQINVKLAAISDCYGDTRVLPVKPAPVTNMTRLPHDKPVWSDPDVGTLRWHWDAASAAPVSMPIPIPNTATPDTLMCGTPRTSRSKPAATR